MKSESEIRSRLNALVLQELDRRVQEATTRLPWLCTHNHQQLLDNRKSVEGVPNENYNRIVPRSHLPVAQTIGLCMLGASNPEEWPGDICDEPIDALRCPYFNPKRTKQDILAEYQQQMNDLKWVEVHMPEAFGLMWALEAMAQTSLPWWKRVWFWFVPMKPEPVQPQGIEVTALLPEGREDARVDS